MKKQMIIARFREPFDWIDDVPEVIEVVLYNKGRGSTGIKLDNTGREAHTYLTHIIDNYDNLPDICIFTQGWPFDHVKDFIRQSSEINSCDYYDFGVQRSRYALRDKVMTRAGMPMFKWVAVERIHEVLNLMGDKMYLENCRLGLPTMIDVSHFATFSVGRDIIRTYPIDFYEHLREISTSYDDGPYILEVLWRVLFA